MGLLPTTLNPQFAQGSRDHFLASHLYEGLFRVGRGGKVVPGLAQHVSVSEDGLHYRITLRPSHWSDGTPLTAHDFVRSWQGVLQPKKRFPALGFHFRWIAGGSSPSLVAEDSQTLVFSLKQRVPYFLKLLALPVFYPVLFDRNTFVSNGPFRLKQSDHFHEMVLEKNPFFWDQASVRLDQLKIVYIEEQAQISLFEKGEIDVIGSQFVPLYAEEIKEKLLPSKKIFSTDHVSSISFIRVNTLKGGLRSRKIRQALSMCLNRQALSDLSSGLMPPAYRYLPPTVFPQGHVVRLEESVLRARLLLEEGLREEGLVLSALGDLRLCCLHFCKNLAEAIQQQFLENLGLTIKVDLLDLPDFFKRISDGDFDLALSRFISSYEDPYAFFDLFVCDRGGKSTWDSSLLHALFQKGLSLNEESRMLYVARMEQLLLDELPVIPFSFGYCVYVVQPGLKGVLTNGLMTVDLSRAYWEE
ncbi:Oligopeptide ABC transporter, periplasmic oligopeptide-binding protein OppA [Candidatus Similichlamydia laticola]|uniref:Oligopeptide ABC transporter, periplasmic oligopeptide-binding protein OppA n=1 Tax=Candidatus Similichlamydia laticola TaxID=2170265 RepID=A0A369KG15_9BACT|nr:Oligopeptide ABC transporter, periplasmic oligopeptide-binding protein OppA [Candidatus Similichlamydia laticola]